VSRVQTFLVLVLYDWDENWREDLLIMDEQQVMYELGRDGMPSYPVRRERHLFFPLLQPLTREQLAWLEEHKTRGLFASFHVRDEVTPDIPGQGENEA
jgi:hypothetical protein